MSEEHIKMRIQRMFPNCDKYNHCCDVNWNPKLENVKDVPQPEVISNKPRINNVKKPRWFDGF